MLVKPLIIQFSPVFIKL